MVSPRFLSKGEWSHSISWYFSLPAISISIYQIGHSSSAPDRKPDAVHATLQIPSHSFTHKQAMITFKCM